MNRTTHRFQFSGRQISDAATREAEQREERVAWWTTEYERAVVEAKEAGVTVREYDVTGGKRAAIGIDTRLTARVDEAYAKRRAHQEKADQYRIEAASYGTQPDRTYELDSDDVMHWRLAGGARDD